MTKNPRTKEMLEKRKGGDELWCVECSADLLLQCSACIRWFRWFRSTNNDHDALGADHTDSGDCPLYTKWFSVRGQKAACNPLKRSAEIGKVKIMILLDYLVILLHQIDPFWCIYLLSSNAVATNIVAALLLPRQMIPWMRAWMPLQGQKKKFLSLQYQLCVSIWPLTCLQPYHIYYFMNWVALLKNRWYQFRYIINKWWNAICQ